MSDPFRIKLWECISAMDGKTIGIRIGRFSVDLGLSFQPVSDEGKAVGISGGVSEEEYRNALTDLKEEPYDENEVWHQSFFVKAMSMVDADETIYWFLQDNGDWDKLPPEVHAFARRRIFASFMRGFDELVKDVGSDERMNEIMADAESVFEDFEFAGED